MMKKFQLLCATAALFAPAAAMAQETTATIRGDVVAAGSPVAGAEVVITHVPSGTQSTSTTGSDGSFNASGLRVGGPFTVAVTAPGYEQQEITDIFLTAGTPFRVPVELTAAGEEIVVTGVRGAREQSQGPITTLTREEIEGVASVSRDIRDIARRDPFVTLDASNSRTIEIAGQNGRLNRFSVDGVQFSDDFGINNGGLPTSRGPVPYDAIEQLSVKIAPFDVEEGDFQGGAVNVVLRSGGNDFTGSAFYSYSDDSLTGDSIRGVPVDLTFDSTSYGAFLSGPIVPNRVFFAVAYSKLDEGQPVENGPEGLGFASPIPRITQPLLDQISSIASARYGIDTQDVLSTTTEEDEKLTAKLDVNISDDHRASLTYIRNVGSNQFTQNTSTSVTGPTFGFRSNGYELTEEINTGVFQLNSDWADNFATEVRVAYRDYNRGQTPFGGTANGQFEVCLDPTSVVQVSPLTNTVIACGSTTESNGRVFFGPDISRQANVLNTSNLSADFRATTQFGIHSLKFLAGYSTTDVFNLFLQRATGDFYFDSIADLEAGRASRFRLSGAVPSGDVNDAAGAFRSNVWTVGLQDDIDVRDNLQVSVGARYDLYKSDDVPAENPNFLARYGYLNTVTFDGLGVLQPRIGFNWTPKDRVIVRGGVGLFAGGTPDVFLSNSFSNTGLLTNSIDVQRNSSAQGCNQSVGATLEERIAFCNAALTITDGTTFDPAVLSFLQTNTASLAAAPTNAVDPDFDLPSQWRATLSGSYEADLGALGDGWLFGVDLVYGAAHRAINYIDLRSVANGTLPDGRPRYRDLEAGTPRASTNQDLLLTNDNRGRSWIGVVRFDKQFDSGIGIGASYTRQDIKDVNAITSATAGSLYGNNAMADPNRADYGRSIYEITNSLKFSIDFKHAFFGDYETRFSIFGDYRSGRPYSYTFQDSNPNGRSSVFGTLGTANRYLLYVPTGIDDPLVSYDSTATRDALEAFIDDHKGLSKYRGGIVDKNTATSPSVFKVDLHADQELPVPLWRKARIKLFADFENFLNFLDSDWGVQRQQPFAYFANLVSVSCLSTATPTGTAPAPGVSASSPSGACTQYRYSNFSEPTVDIENRGVQNQSRQSLYQIRVGVRFEF